MLFKAEPKSIAQISDVLQRRQHLVAREQRQHGVDAGCLRTTAHQHTHRRRQLRHLQAALGQHGLQRGRDAGLVPGRQGLIGQALAQRAQAGLDGLGDVRRQFGLGRRDRPVF